MFDTTKHLHEKDLMSNAKLAEALIAVINEVQQIAKEVQEIKVDVNKLVENNKQLRSNLMYNKLNMRGGLNAYTKTKTCN